MTQEDKQLLLKDLCARLPYNPILQVNLRYGDNEHKEGVYYGEMLSISSEGVECNYNNTPDFSELRYWPFCFDEIKPYLRPIDSMTESEWKEFHAIDTGYIRGDMTARIDFYNSHHIDFRLDKDNKTMIEKGLALEAPKGMYN